MQSGRNGILLPALLVLTLASSAHALEPDAATDTSYGRLRGDVTLVTGVGISVADTPPRLLGDLRLRYLDSAGVFGTYEDGASFGIGADPRRVFTVGIEARPLFLPRWLSGKEFGQAHLDLILDSLGIELGAVWLEPNGASFSSRPGLSLGLGLEIPIVPSATGVWVGLHGGVRWSDTAMAGAPLAGPETRQGYLSVTFAWHQLIGTHASDLGDRAPH